MEIGGAEFIMGFSNEVEDDETPKVALKVVVFGMDDMETAQAVYERISATLVNMDPKLELSAITGDNSAIN